MNENPYEAPVASAIEPKQIPPAKPGPILIVFTILIVLINVFFSFVLTLMLGLSGSYSIGYIFGRVFLVPCLVLGLFQIGKTFRNSRSQTKIFLWTSVVVLLSILGNISANFQGQI